ncbi:acyl-CoA N-acyltransferase [Pelagophyceae sp. CCMP2097]|nr:acyl-CoA N-acyltransferase [Pelagophyceae sp. CCMP2097]
METVQLLRELKALVDEGVLTAAEFAATKTDLLAGLKPATSGSAAAASAAAKPARGGSRRGWDVRTADEEDAPGIAALVNAAHVVEVEGARAYRAQPRITAAEVAKSLTDDSEGVTWLVAENAADETLLAAVCVRLIGPVCHRIACVEAVSVAPQCQRRGVGAKMLGLAEASAKSSGAQMCVADVAEWRDDARDFFAKAGYVQEGHPMAWPRDLAHEISKPTKTATLQKRVADFEVQADGVAKTGAGEAPETAKRFTGGAPAAKASPLDRLSHSEPVLLSMGTSTKQTAKPPPAAAFDVGGLDLDAVTAQFELVGSLQGLVAMLDRADDAPTAAGARVDDSERDDDALEGLLGSLLKSLKTDRGRDEFEVLAARQAAPPPPPEPSAAAGLAAFAPRRGFVPRPASECGPPGAAATTCSVDFADPRALTDLLVADERFGRDRTTRNADDPPETAPPK